MHSPSSTSILDPTWLRRVVHVPLPLLAALAMAGSFGSSGCIKESKQVGDTFGPADTALPDDVSVANEVEDSAAPDVSLEDTAPADTALEDTAKPPDTSAPRCGDHTCDPGETRNGCPVDCGCGNGTCEPSESAITCQVDCCADSVCGDCTCDAACGENPTNCPHDCFACGDGVVTPGEIDCGCVLDACRCPGGGAGCGDGCCMGYLCSETPGNCPQDCGSGCGNGECERGETPVTCAEDCDQGACGNGLCEANNDETPTTCAADCAAVCGNCQCEGGETYLNCPPDCGFCGDKVCSNCPSLDERDACPADCEP